MRLASITDFNRISKTLDKLLSLWTAYDAVKTDQSIVAMSEIQDTASNALYLEAIKHI